VLNTVVVRLVRESFKWQFEFSLRNKFATFAEQKFALAELTSLWFEPSHPSMQLARPERSQLHSSDGRMQHILGVSERCFL
jgi:hypothetical protein